MARAPSKKDAPARDWVDGRMNSGLTVNVDRRERCRRPILLFVTYGKSGFVCAIAKQFFQPIFLLLATIEVIWWLTTELDDDVVSLQ